MKPLTPNAATPQAPTHPRPARLASVLALALLLPFLASHGLWAQDEAAEAEISAGNAEEPADVADPADVDAPADEEAYEEAAHDALRELRAIYEQAVNENRIELLEPHLEEGVVGIMVTGEVVEGFDELRQYWQDLLDLIGEGGSYTTALEPQLSWIHGDVAVAKGSTSDVVTVASGKEYHFTSSFTAVLVNHDGQWKVRRMQGTMDPVNNVFVEAKVRGAALWTGGAALAVGLILGWLLGRFGPGGRRSAAEA